MMMRKLGVGDLQKGERYVLLIMVSVFFAYVGLLDMQTWTTFFGQHCTVTKVLA